MRLAISFCCLSHKRLQSWIGGMVVYHNPGDEDAVACLEGKIFQEEVRNNPCHCIFAFLVQLKYF